jgi:hypothetical protein
MESIHDEFNREATLLRRSVVLGAITPIEAKRKMHELMRDLVDDQLRWLYSYMHRSTNAVYGKDWERDFLLYNEDGAE